MILVPGLDAVNHETHYSNHPDFTYSQIKFVKGKITIHASRPFKTGEEFLINYDYRSSALEIFKTRG